MHTELYSRPRTAFAGAYLDSLDSLCGRAVASEVDSCSWFYESALMLMEVLHETASVPTLQQVFGLLNAHGDAHEVVRKAARGAHLSRNGGVAHVARQRYQ